ncbi:3-phosphoshikimate 1-carboxyvinyltransferase [bacterium]|nr:3-phosphoshikimate 1-carboxyvinyltransferase [bacterium]
MKVTVRKSRLSGSVAIPGSKSHTIRALIIGALADGESVIEEPLDSLDTRSAASAVGAFGARVDRSPSQWTVAGTGGRPRIPDNVIDVGNSGTTLYMIMGTASLVDGWTVLTGDDQIRRRTAAPLIEALGRLGVGIFSTRDNGCAPLAVRGRIQGGKTSVAAISSQYLSSLLMACPLAGNDTEITVTVLNERPYVAMTMNWLTSQGIELTTDEAMGKIAIRGGQSYHAFRRRVPGDFSSATFMLCAGVLAGGEVRLHGLEMDDPQGDKEVITILREMGADITVTDEAIIVRGGSLRGTTVDMNAIPDALPMLAACACFAEGTTVLRNVKQARIKETDRIAVMAQELAKLGGDITELPDGLEIRGTGLKGGSVHGHGDHRVVMACAVAGCAADGPVTIDTAEAADVTFPGFWEKIRALGADIR